MSDTISYQGKSVTVIIDKKLKHTYLKIDDNKSITIKTSYTSKKFISLLLEEKNEWIQKQFQKIESFTVIGKNPINTKQFIEERVLYFSGMMQLSFEKLKFRKMRRRWGSCSTAGVITLNSELVKIEKPLIDYVVVHELAHLKYMNHSKEFHELVECYLKDSKELRQKLKKIRLLS